MRLGGFVIHGSAVAGLDRCIESLVATCDVVVAVDNSRQGATSSSLHRGIESVRANWRGFGAARAVAVRRLRELGANWIFFLDSDEHLTDSARRTVLAWKETQPQLGVYRLPRRNWVTASGHRYVYNTDWRARLVREDLAPWCDTMVVHESLPPHASAKLHAPIEHDFVSSLDFRTQKDRQYALLWAVQHAHGERRGRNPHFARLGHFLRDASTRGALLRGGRHGFELAWRLSEYSALKYAFLREIRAGLHVELLEAFEAGRLEDLFEMVREVVFSGSRPRAGGAPRG